VRGLVDPGRCHHRRRLRAKAAFLEPAELVRSGLGAVEAQRDVPSCRERCREAVQPRPAVLRSRHLSQKEEIAPPVGRVVWAANDEMVAPVLDLGPAASQEGEIGPVPQRDHVHARTVGEPWPCSKADLGSRDGPPYPHEADRPEHDREAEEDRCFVPLHRQVAAARLIGQQFLELGGDVGGASLGVELAGRGVEGQAWLRNACVGARPALSTMLFE